MKTQSIERSEPISSTTESNVISFNLSETNQTKLIESFYGNLYKDIKFALVREWLANAYDAHAEAGILDRPIKVSLPTNDNLTFSVTNYGIGIDEERIKILTSYGETTKAESDTQTGGFGIGLKVVYGYKPLFTLTTVSKGVEYAYLGEITKEHPMGCLILVNQKYTSKEDQTTISVSVDEKDKEKFLLHYVNVTLYWDVKPKVNLDKQFFCHSFLETKNFHYFLKSDSDNYYRRGRVRFSVDCIIKMGAVSYSTGLCADDFVKSGELKKIMSDNFDPLFSNLRIIPVYKANTNEFEVTQSRDSLTTSSLGAVSHVGKKAQLELHEELSRRAEKHKSAGSFVESLVHSFFSSEEKFLSLGEKAKEYKDLGHKKYKLEPFEEKIDNILATLFSRISSVKINGLNFSCLVGEDSWRSPFLVFDNETNISKTKMDYIQSIICDSIKTDGNRVHSLTYIRKKDLDNVCDFKFLPNSFLFSDWKHLIEEEVEGKKTKKTKVLKYISHDQKPFISSSLSAFLKKEHVDVTKPFFWIPSNHEELKRGNVTSYYSVFRALQMLNEFCAVKIYVLTENQIKKYKPDPDLQFPEYASLNFMKLLPEVSIDYIFCMSMADLRFSDRSYLKVLLKTLESNTVIKKLLDINEQTDGAYKRIDEQSKLNRSRTFSYKCLAEIFFTKFKVTHPVVDDFKTSAMRKYPLLLSFLSSENVELRNYVVDYVETIDKNSRCL